MLLGHLSTLFCCVFGAVAFDGGRKFVSSPEAKIVSYVKGGVLVKNGQVTSCELSVIDSSAVVLAASCLDYSLGTNLDMSTKYDIYLDTGMNGIGAHYGVDKIVIHPSYNPSNFVNNIAIMEFNLDSEIAWQNKIAPVLDYEWDEIGLISGIPTDLNKLKWEGFIYNFTRFSTSSTCNKLSEMYEANSKDLLCALGYGTAVALSDYNCPVPYGTALGLANGTAHIIGPFNYVAISGGSDLCSFTDQRSYFTSLANYIGFIKDTIKRDVLIDSLFQFDTSKLDIDYKMVDRDFKDNNGLASTKITGNFYGDHSVEASSVSNSGIGSKPDTNVGSTASDNKSEGITSSEGNHSSGMSTKTIIVVAVCASIGGVIIVSIAPFLAFWYWRRRKAMRYPIGQARYQDMIESELAGAGTRGGMPSTASESSDPDPANQILNLYQVELPPVYEEDSNIVPHAAAKPDKPDAKSL